MKARGRVAGRFYAGRAGRGAGGATIAPDGRKTVAHGRCRQADVSGRDIRQREKAVLTSLGGRPARYRNQNSRERRSRPRVDDNPLHGGGDGGDRRLCRGTASRGQQDHDQVRNRLHDYVGSGVEHALDDARISQQMRAVRAVHRLLYRVVQAA